MEQHTKEIITTLYLEDSSLLNDKSSYLVKKTIATSLPDCHGFNQHGVYYRIIYQSSPTEEPIQISIPNRRILDKLIRLLTWASMNEEA